MEQLQEALSRAQKEVAQYADSDPTKVEAMSKPGALPQSHLAGLALEESLWAVPLLPQSQSGFLPRQGLFLYMVCPVVQPLQCCSTVHHRRHWLQGWRPRLQSPLPTGGLVRDSPSSLLHRRNI